MKKLQLSILLLLLSFAGYAQTAASYSFSAFSSSYSSISSTGTSVGSVIADDYTQTSISIGFTFNYCGTNYTTLSASSNGFISLNNSSAAPFTVGSTLMAGSGVGILMPDWVDLEGFSGTSTAYYLTTGTSPNRVFTFEWKNFGVYGWPGASGQVNMQVKLYETSNVIDFCYSNSTLSGMGYEGDAIGIANSSTDWQTLNNDGTSPTPSSSTFYTTTITTAPDNGQVYRWANQCAGTPTTGLVSATLDSSCTTFTSTLSLPTSSIGSGLSYQWQSSPDGTTWTNIAGATSATYTATVTANTYYRCIMTCSYSGLSATSAGLELFVHTPPLTISGAGAVCVGNTLSLTDATSGGIWSSSASGTASVASTTGVVTGVAVGTATITYTLSTGCYITAVVTVNTSPAIIIGASSVCQGLTTPFTDATPGGTWSSSAGGTASVGTSGIVTGVAVGVATITYTIGSCFSVKTVSVTPSPAAITGLSAVCVGSSITESSTTTGGTWTSTPISGYATIGSSSGVVTGVTAGTTGITYTMPGGCYVYKIITVNPLPTGIAGLPTVCLGATDGLFDFTSGGTWSSSSSGIISVGSLTGVALGVSLGSATIIYTLSTGCNTTFAMSVTPTPGPILGGDSVCLGGTLILTDTSAGDTWTSSDYSIAYIDATSGTVTGEAIGVATISYTSVVTGCYSLLPFTVNALPGAIGGTSHVCIGASATLTDATGGGTWSVSGTAATIGSATGIITGVTAATGGTVVTVTYTLPTGCSVSEPFTIYPLPAAISGTTVLCVGATSTLADLTSGGTWSSSASGIAGIGAGSGLLTGVSFGTATISYTISSTGCYATTVATINSAPAAITGTMNVCIGSTTTLSDASPGGTWSDSPLSIGTIGATTGTFTGIATGVAVVTYSVGTGSCAAYATVTVNPLPSTITGVTHVCQGSTIILADGGGGTWSSSLTAIGTVGASSGIVFGVSPGTTVITYTLGTGCSRSTNVTVNGLPASFSVTGGGSFCVGGTGVDIGLSGSVLGVTYQLYLGTTAIGAPMAGTGSSLDFGLHTATGTYTVIATISATGCSSTMSGSAVISTNPLPLAYTVTGGGGRYCSGGTGVTVCLAGSSLGVSYQAQIGTTAYGPVVAGTGGAICLGPLTTAGAYTILATNITTGCSRTMTGTYTVTVDPTPVITGPTAVCVGSTITENSSVASGTWNSSVPSVASVATASPTTASVIGHTSGSTTVITYTSPASSGSCSANITVTVSPSPSGIVGLTTVCEGLTDTLSDIVPGGGWTSTPATLGSIDPASGVFYASSSATGRDSITYSLGTGCTVGINITINPAPAAISGTSVLCAGSTGSETDASGGGVWTSSNTALVTIGSSSGSITASAFSSGVDTITYTRGCPVTKTVTVNAIPASISGTNNVCRGSSITLSSSTPGGTWSVSGSATISGTSGTATLTGGAVTAATAVTVTYAVAGCATTFVVTINPLPSAVSSPGHVCQGQSITLTDPSGGGSWVSSSPAIGSISGGVLLTGVTPGTTLVTYTLPTGCTTTATVTVNTTPGPISGPSSVCVSQGITLTDATTGGTWSSSDPSKATITAGGGGVYGVAAGALTISYTLGGCAVSYPFTVVPAPAAITGPAHVCLGQAIVLHDVTTGGIWNSGSPSIASVNSLGDVIGLSVGTAIISYGSAGCAQILPVVVYPLSPIFGTPVVCVGQATTLYDTTSGAGTWSSSSDSATVDIHGVVTGVNAGVFTISYELTTGCITTSPVTVNPIPAPISGPANVCVGSLIVLTDATSAGTWSSSDPSVGSIDAVGNFTGVSATSPTPVTVSYAMPVTGCPVTKVITVNPLPLPVSGISNVCLGGTSSLSETAIGAWVSLAPAIASVSPSTGSATIVTGVALGTTTISYIAAATGCAIGTTVNVVSPPPPVNPPLSLCQDGSLTLTDPAGPGSWYSGSPAVATVDVSTGVVTTGSYGTSVITYVAAAGCSITAVLTVNPVPVMPSGPTTLCPGQSVTYTTTAGGIWVSSDPTVASIGSISGMITAIMPVTTTITYTLPTGCALSFPVFVNTPPDPILGNPQICITNTTSLSDATPGGTWGSDHPGIASVDAFGTVTGNALGLALISYRVSGTVCPAILEVTVNPQPTTITGRMVVCQGDTTLLSDGVFGGAWTTSDPTIATVSARGAVSGVISGYTTPMTADITYSLGSGCTKTVTVTVNPVPQPISGPNTLCANAVVALSDPTTGGTWSSASTSVATIDASGNLTGVNPGGVALISYTQSGCAATYPVTVNTQPTAITGNTNVCLDGTSLLHEAYGPGTWMSTGTGVATINSATGLVTGVSTGATTIVYTMAAGSCATSVVVNVIPLPTVFNITGGGNYCAGGSGVAIGIDGSNTGTTYLLYHGSTAAGTYTGTGTALDFGLQTVAGGYTAVATTSSTGCSKPMSGIATIVINPTVTPDVTISTPKDTVCAGTSVTFTPAPTNGGLLPSYIWQVNGVGVGPGNTYTFVPANGDMVTVTMYSSANCPLPATADSKPVTMVVTPYAYPTVYISSVPSDTVCKGTEVTLNAVTTYGGYQPVYLWRLNGMLLIGSTSGSYTYVPDNGDQLFVHLNSNYPCRLATSDSSTLRMQVDTAAMPIVTINASPGTVLGLGQPGTFTASVTNAVNPTYQWIKNGYPIIGATNASYTAYDFSYPREDSLTCMVTSNGICKITAFQWVYVQVSTEGVQQISSSASDFSVIPNPNKGAFTIKGSLSTTADEAVTLELTDVLGQVVYHNELLTTGGKINEHIQVANSLANGMYILSLHSDSDNKVFHIVIEQ